MTTQTHTTDGRPRARGLGIVLPGEPGPLNAITDVVDGRTDGYLNDLTSSPRLKPRDPNCSLEQ